MADASRSSIPPGWGEVFTALPLDAPSDSRWPAVAAALEQQARAHAGHPRHRVRRALVASLFALAALPAVWLLRDARTGTQQVAGTSAVVSQRSRAATTASMTPATTPAAVARAEPATSMSEASSGASDTSVAMNGDPAPQMTLASQRPTTVGQRPRDRTTRRAAFETATMPDAASREVAPRDNTESTLETLYSASAQLETLLTLARDTRVESGPAAALASALDAELATIDAQLAQPGLQALQQQALWQARVDTLQEATGFETRQRLLSAQGRRYDGALVSVD